MGSAGASRGALRGMRGRSAGVEVLERGGAGTAGTGRRSVHLAADSCCAGGRTKQESAAMELGAVVRDTCDGMADGLGGGVPGGDYSFGGVVLPDASKRASA